MKKNILKIISIASLALSVVSCQSDEKEDLTRNIYIESVPTGAGIIIDGFKMGSTPLSVNVETTSSGYFVRTTTITAVPQSDNLHTHVKTFPGFREESASNSKVPEKITFMMEKNPAASDDGIVLD